MAAALQLGWAGDRIAKTDDAGSDCFDKIGGLPSLPRVSQDFPFGCCPPPELARCRACGSDMYLIVQFCAPLPDSPERTLHVLACNRRQCMQSPGSWRVLRGIVVRKNVAVKSPHSFIGKNENSKKSEDGSWASVASKANAASHTSSSTVPFVADSLSATGFGAFGEDDEDMDDAMDEIERLLNERDKKKQDKPPRAVGPTPTPALFEDPILAADLEIESETPNIVNNVVDPPAPVPKQSPRDEANGGWSQVSAFPSYYLEFSEDQSEGAGSSKKQHAHEMKLLEGYQRAAESAETEDGGGEWAAEEYEKSRPKYYNKGFKRFQKIVTENPEQCMRYHYNGTPLFFATDAVSESLTKTGPPRCTFCNAPRIFEFQLMPALLALLPTEAYAKRVERAERAAAGEDANDFVSRFARGMEFGTVLAFVCSRDCGGAGENEGDMVFVEEYAGVQLEALA
ncbi:programmed cell death protein 2 [Cladochytrium replicatum]|nr:programmed cell death protein 2 [Cladochytrium replicatum]